MTRTAPSMIGTLVLFAGLFVASATLLLADEKPGYDDTPMLPDSQWRVHDKNRPQAPIVEPGAKPGDPPAGAIVLFDGQDISEWEGLTSPWEGLTADAIEDGAINVLKTAGMTTKQKFGDCQLHVEWATPVPADGGPMNWGNSGIFFHGLYELQIIESKVCHIYADGIAGAIYGQYPPLANPSRGPGQWQTFDAVFLAPKFDGDKLVEPARMTVFWNGVLVQYHQKILGATKHKMSPDYHTKIETGPLVIQQHNSAVRLRNIWIRPLELDER